MCNHVEKFDGAHEQTRQHLVVHETSKDVILVTGRKREEVAPLTIDESISLCRPWPRATGVTYA